MKKTTLRVNKIRLRPNDRLVIMCNVLLSEEEREHIGYNIRKWAPDNQFLILDRSTKLARVRRKTITLII